MALAGAGDDGMFFTLFYIQIDSQPLLIAGIAELWEKFMNEPEVQITPQGVRFQ